MFSVFDPATIVYLSPDAEEALDEVVETNVYVVGGIVDRNLHKGLTLGAAGGGGARAARLPFDEHLPEVPRGDRVLTVCACVGVLMGVHAGQGWREALEKSVPRRVGVEKAAQRAARGGAWRGAKIVSDSAGPGSSGWGVIGAGTPGNRPVVGADSVSLSCAGGGGDTSGGSSRGLEAGDPKESERMLPSRSPP